MMEMKFEWHWMSSAHCFINAYSYWDEIKQQPASSRVFFEANKRQFAFYTKLNAMICMMQLNAWSLENTHLFDQLTHWVVYFRYTYNHVLKCDAHVIFCYENSKQCNNSIFHTLDGRECVCGVCCLTTYLSKQSSYICKLFHSTVNFIFLVRIEMKKRKNKHVDW